jgi:hypothetical protein
MRIAGSATLLHTSAARWLQLIVLTVVLTALFEGLGLPASRLIGLMVAAIALTLHGAGSSQGEVHSSARKVSSIAFSGAVRPCRSLTRCRLTGARSCSASPR